MYLYRTWTAPRLGMPRPAILKIAAPTVLLLKTIKRGIMRGKWRKAIGRFPAGPVRAAAAVLLLAAALQSAPAVSQGSAQPRRVHLTIAPADLQSALLQFASQADVQLIVNAEDTRGLSASGLSGDFSVEQALTKLLAGSGLQYKMDSAGTVTIMRAAVPEARANAAQVVPTPRPPSQEPVEERLQEIVITAQKRLERLQDVPVSV